MSNETNEYTPTDAKTSYKAFKHLVDSRSTILKVSTGPDCFQCKMATRWAKERGFHDGVEYIEVYLSDLDHPDEAIAYLRRVLSTAFDVSVDKMPNAAPWFINLRHVPKTSINKDGEMTSEEPSAIDFNSPTLQLFGYQPSNLPTLFSGTLPAREQEMCLVA